jgi:hypothetical protein
VPHNHIFGFSRPHSEVGVVARILLGILGILSILSSQLQQQQPRD